MFSTLPMRGPSARRRDDIDHLFEVTFQGCYCDDARTIGPRHPRYFEDFFRRKEPDIDDTRTISSHSTNSTVDDNPGPGRVLDKHFYQPFGRKLERAISRIILSGNRQDYISVSPRLIRKAFYQIFTYRTCFRANRMAMTHKVSDLTRQIVPLTITQGLGDSLTNTFTNRTEESLSASSSK